MEKEIQVRICFCNAALGREAFRDYDFKYNKFLDMGGQYANQ
jgi:hypothetical protein